MIKTKSKTKNNKRPQEKETEEGDDTVEEEFEEHLFLFWQILYI